MSTHSNSVHRTYEFRSGPYDAEGYYYQYMPYNLKIPTNNKHYRLYLSRRANAYKKYHGKVRKSVDNDQLSSVAAHKAWLTRELKDIQYWFKRDIFEQCNNLLITQK